MLSSSDFPQGSALMLRHSWMSSQPPTTSYVTPPHNNCSNWSSSWPVRRKKRYISWGHVKMQRWCFRFLLKKKIMLQLIPNFIFSLNELFNCKPSRVCVWACNCVLRSMHVFTECAFLTNTTTIDKNHHENFQTCIQMWKYSLAFVWAESLWFKESSV